jgi:hypothetical protein
LIITLLVAYLFWTQVLHLGEMLPAHADELKELARQSREFVDANQAIRFGTDHDRAASDKVAVTSHFWKVGREIDKWNALMSDRDSAFTALRRKATDKAAEIAQGRNLVIAQVEGALWRQAEGHLSDPATLPAFVINEGPIPTVGRGLWLGGSALAGFPDDAPDSQLQEVRAALEQAIADVANWAQLDSARGVSHNVRQSRAKLRSHLVAIERSHRIRGSCPQCR